METPNPPTRPLRSAVLLAIGSELTVGETRDTNSGELARALAETGTDVAWISALPDRLGLVTAALDDALAAADLVVTTGGLGPTPDDLTREAIAEVCGERPVVDPDLERRLRHLFERRGVAFARTNLKQAWLIPSAKAIPNDRGTAPGWWVDRPHGRVIVALPGPPSEMRPMWQGWVLPRLRDRGLGQDRVTRTYRLAGIGESAVAAQLGEPLLRAENPVVATYARADAVDVRISAVGEVGRPAEAMVEEAVAAVLAAVGEYVWGYGDDTWPDVLGRKLQRRGWTVALIEGGTGGATARLLGDVSWLRATRAVAATDSGAAGELASLAEGARREAGTSIGLAVRAVETAEDTRVDLAAAGPWGVSETSQIAFLGGSEGRRRASLAAAAFLNGMLKDASGG
ncbi:MAG: molybdopterin-binding protein [Candidatus Limnocylindrales bacterium]|jgi:nicotinamide-nucleotide amidase